MAGQIDESEADQPEAPHDYFRSVFRWTAEFTKIRKYFRTRQAVINGDALYERTRGDLKRTDLMGPLTFNVYETTLAALPTQLVLATVWFLWGGPADSPVLSENPNPPADVYSSGMSVLLPKLQTLVTPLMVPSTALAMAWVAALLSLRRRDWTRHKKRRARDAFLYYDGAHGLIPECALALLFTVAPILSAGLFQLVFMGLSVIAYFAARKTEDELGSANGYSTGPYDRVMAFGLEEPLPAFPTRRYRVGFALMALPIAIGMLLALNVSAFVAASALSSLRAWLR